MGWFMTKKYTLIYADPPWVYRDKAADGNRGAGFKYPVMSVLDICRLPVWDLADENCLLAMWWVPTQPLEALKVVEAWGFRLMTMKGFTWIKCGSRQPDKLVMGMGHMTRANSEDCLFAVKENYLHALMQGSFSHLPHRGLSIQENQMSFVKNLCNC